jgi:hypothetical protein
MKQRRRMNRLAHTAAAAIVLAAALSHNSSAPVTDPKADPNRPSVIPSLPHERSQQPALIHVTVFAQR